MTTVGSSTWRSTGQATSTPWNIFGPSLAAATPSYPFQSTGSSQEVTTAVTPGAGANTAAARPADADTAGAATDDGGKDLTVFFVIGIAVNIIMITAFLFWAAGQWRKTRK